MSKTIGMTNDGHICSSCNMVWIWDGTSQCALCRSGEPGSGIMVMEAISHDKLDGKTVQHAFALGEAFYCGFVDGTWWGIRLCSDYECGYFYFSGAYDFYDLFHDGEVCSEDALDDFIKAGIVKESANARNFVRELERRRLLKELEIAQSNLAFAQCEIKKFDARVQEIEREENGKSS
jgi:hypothetical protein